VKVAITGSSGFVGSHFMKALEKFSPVGIDIVTENRCEDFFDNTNEYYDLLIHAAGNVGGRLQIENNPTFISENLVMDQKMCSWITKCRCNKAVVFSSSAVYPIELQQNPMTKLKEEQLNLDAIQSPDKLYGLCKLVLEYQVKDLKKQGYKIYIFRPFSGYCGITQEKTYPFPMYIHRAVSKQNPFDIWGGWHSN